MIAYKDVLDWLSTTQSADMSPRTRKLLKDGWRRHYKEKLMHTIAEQYIDDYGSAREAIPPFVADLMRDDPAHHKRGYTRENAIIAAAEAFDISRDAVEELVP